MRSSTTKVLETKKTTAWRGGRAKRRIYLNLCIQISFNVSLNHNERERREWKVQINFAGNCAFKHITSYGIFSVIYPWNIGFQLIILIINLILIGQDNSKNSNTSNFPLFLQYLTFRAPLIEMIILGIFIHRIEFSEKRDAETEKNLPFHHREWKKILYRSNSIKIVSGAHSSINYISFFLKMYF